MLPHQIQNYFEKENTFICAFIRYNLPPRINDRKFVVNIDRYLKRGTHYIALYE